MKIVIDIPEKWYIWAKFNDIANGSMVSKGILDAVANGTPLPKVHGRLIDANAYIDKHEACGWLDGIAVDEFNTITPTIIEAEGGDNNGNKH